MKTVVTLCRPVLRALAVLCLVFYSVETMAEAPTAVPDARSMSINGQSILNLTDNDFDADGDFIFIESITQPANGSAELNSDGSVIYTPNTDFSGTDRFTYVLADASEEGLTTIGEVTITVQDGAYTPFAGGRNSLALAEVFSAVCNELEGQSGAQLGSALSQLAAVCDTVAAVRASNPDNPGAVANALRQITPEEVVAQMRVAVDANRSQAQTVSQRVQQQRFALNTKVQNTVALNGRQWSFDGPKGAGAGDEDPSIWSKLGVFASIQIEDADRDRTEFESGYEADGASFTLGADYFLSQSLLIGSTIGFGDSSLSYKGEGGELETTLTTLAAFGAYFHGDFSVYAQLAQARMDFDSSRRVAFGADGLEISEVLNSATTGKQVMVNTRAEWDWTNNALRLTPFARLDYIKSNIDAFSEQGFGGLAMRMGEQSTTQLTIVTGLQSAYTLKPSWGVFIPTLALSFLSEAESERDPVTASFAADSATDRAFSLRNDGGDKRYYQVSLGASAVFKGGVSAFVDYTQILSYDNLSAYQAQLGVRYEL